MPKNLTEADAFTSPVVVPIGIDSRNNAANVVEALAQVLTDRTRYLLNRTGKLGVSNEWTHPNTFAEDVTINDTLTLRGDAALTPAVVMQRNAGGSVYELLFTINVSATAGDNLYIYSCSSGPTIGALLIVYNAVWGGSAWALVNTGQPATALIIRNGDVRIVGKPANVNPATWTAWGQTAPNIDSFGGSLLAEVLQAARAIAIGNTTADYSNGFRYANPVTRISPIPLGLCWGDVRINALGEIERGNEVADYNHIWFPVPVPPFSTFTTVSVQFRQLQVSNPDQFQLYRRQQAGAWVAQGGVETHGTMGGLTIASLHPGAAQVVLDGDEWAYRWRVVSGDLQARDNRIVGLSVTWQDYGPSNRVG